MAHMGTFPAWTNGSFTGTKVTTAREHRCKSGQDHGLSLSQTHKDTQGTQVPCVNTSTHTYEPLVGGGVTVHLTPTWHEALNFKNTKN